MEHTTPRPPQLTGAAAVMYDAMSQISEAAHGVRWHPGTEYGVWMLLTEPRTRFGNVRADEADVASALTTIDALARQAHLWIIWPTGDCAPREMALDNWRVRYAANLPKTSRRTLA
ncbi:MAG: hypothetical protein HOY79_33580 [Streptomyces sp.]|nr:hypothetical protein [Streptomyces sp.]NUS11375.1 hypothetical protein [Streptomyces sp.]NUS23484.1 hypothetical protein [Streptomyces sp.]